MARVPVALLLAGALLTACGGDDSSPNTAGDASGQTSTTSTVGGSDSGSGASGPANYAIVTVGDAVYEFPADPINGCNNFGNIIGASYAIDSTGAPMQAGSTDVGVQLNFVIPEPNWEAQGLQPPSLTVDVVESGTLVRWQAGAFEDIDGVFLTWDLTNGRAEGTVTFTDFNRHRAGEDTTPVPGSFEILCNP